MATAKQKTESRSFINYCGLYLCRLLETKPVAAPSEPWEVAEVKWVKPEQIKELITSSLDPNVAQELKI